MNRFLACIAAFVVCSGGAASAHPAPFSYLDIRVEPAAIDANVVVHLLDVAKELGVDEAALADESRLAALGGRIASLIQSRVRLTVNGRAVNVGPWSPPEPVPDRHGLRLRARYDTGPVAVVSIDAYMFPYDPSHQTFVNLYERGTLVTQAILSTDHRQLEYFAGTRQGTLAVIRKFAASGVHHILIGPDHLLFLVGLLLLGGSLRRLLLVVTAFTAAHSVTLSLAALDIVSPPASVVEPAIALSIVYVGADNLTVRGGRDMRGWIAFAFGLIHGFGFANVLREMDLPPRALGWSLFSFNLGVEIGQMLVVTAVATVLAAIRARSEVAGRRLAVAGSVVVIAAGTFWFVQRVFFSSIA